MEHPPFIDIRDLEARLGDDEQFRPLKRLINRTMLAQSCIADLAQAQDSIEALDNLYRYFGKKDSPLRINIEAALIMAAVTLYARATGGSDSRGERGSSKIASKLPPEQLGDHVAILELRHRAFAHVYANEQLTGDIPWHRDMIFAVATERGWKPGSLVNRLQVVPSMVARLRRQIPVARAILYDRFQLRMTQMSDLMNSLHIDPGRGAGALSPYPQYHRSGVSSGSCRTGYPSGKRFLSTSGPP
jgi:hypothetical protein